MQEMQVVVDISVFGGISLWKLPKGGIYRVAKNVVEGIMNSRECNLTCCASKNIDLWYETLNYLLLNFEFNQIPFIYPKPKYIYKISDNLRKNQKELRKFGKVFSYITKFIELKLYPITKKDLLDKDIFHSLYFAFPPQTQQVRSLKRFITVHDIYPIACPSLYRFAKKHFFNNTLKGLTSKDWIICLSQFTKNELCNYLKFDPERIFVIYPGVEKIFYPIFDKSKFLTLRKKYNIPDAPYILGINSSVRRKNIPRLIKCFAKLIQKNSLEDLYLILVGDTKMPEDKMVKEILNDSTKKRMIFLGFVDDEDLAVLYSNALCFVYISYYEGFGLPVLEAMQCGCPVIVSNTSSLPEVVGDAGIMISPEDDDALICSLYEIINNSKLRRELTLKCIQQAKKFSWEKCINEIIMAYKKALYES